MKVARYMGEGKVAIVDEPEPSCPPGGLLVRTEACGLCSGELMDWYMDRKIPHVLGHEVAGRVIESQDDRFPVGSRVFPHHHAPCMACEMCLSGRFVHCEQWKRTKLVPGGMAEVFSVAAENLNDTHFTGDLRPQDAALIEPLACVVKSLSAAGSEEGRYAIIGLGAMGLMHLLLLGDQAFGYDLSVERLYWASQLGLKARHPDEASPADVIVVCPGNEAALRTAIRVVRPGGRIVLFAPMPPIGDTPVPLNELYFKDVTLTNSYSCGPTHTVAARELLHRGRIKAEQVVSHFIGIDDLPDAYLAMKKGEILKPMVIF